MEIYKKYERFIEEEDTNSIYICVSSYMPSHYTYEEIEEGVPYQIEVPYDNPFVTHRYYYNLEGLHVEIVNIENIPEFEQTHIVIYTENFYKLQREFIVEAVRYSQEKVLRKTKEM